MSDTEEENESVEDDPLLAAEEDEEATFEEIDNETLPGDEIEDGDDLDEEFEEMDVEGEDPDEVWEDIAEDSKFDIDPETADIAEVSKHEYCERCEFFTGPPEVRCTNEGTEILDFIDMETVRLANCPIVAERRGLDQGVAQGATDLGEIERD